MNFSEIASSVISFSKDNPIIAVVVGLFLLFLLFRKPKLFLGLLFLSLILAGVLYFIMDISSTGKSEKGKMIEKGTRPGMDDIR